MSNAPLPDGVALHDLKLHGDARGELRELYRAEWVPSDPFLQWNIVRSNANVLRGVHVHPRHCDYLHVIDGEMVLALHDLRPDDPEERTSSIIRMTGLAPQVVYIPAGVCHGFWFPCPTLYVYGLSTGWSIHEELGCRYDVPELRLDWPSMEAPLLSERDSAPKMSYDEMRTTWIAMQAASACE